MEEKGSREGRRPFFEGVGMWGGEVGRRPFSNDSVDQISVSIELVLHKIVERLKKEEYKMMIVR